MGRGLSGGSRKGAAGRRTAGDAAAGLSRGRARTSKERPEKVALLPASIDRVRSCGYCERDRSVARGHGSGRTAAQTSSRPIMAAPACRGTLSAQRRASAFEALVHGPVPVLMDCPASSSGSDERSTG